MRAVRILSIILGVGIVSLPFIYENRNVLMGGNDILLMALAFVAFLFAGAVILRNPRDAKISISATDVLCAAYLLYGAINVWIVRDGDFDSFIIARWGAIAVAYVLFRLLRDDKVLLWSIVVSAVVQSLYAIGQKVHLFLSNHADFDVTGSLANPGPLGGYLAVGLVAAICLAVDHYGERDKLWMAFAVGSALVAAALYFADSRAAYLSVTVTLMVWTAQFLKRRRWLYVTGVSMVSLIAVLLLYGYRPASANARVLIWTVASGMIADAPLAGHGIGSFEEEYMPRQAEWFEAHPDSPFSVVAGNSAYAYNELIHLAVEQGVLGVLLLLSIIASVLWRVNGNRDQRIFRALLVVLLVFSMFSYSADVFPLMLFFPLLLGTLHGKVVFEKRLSRKVTLATALSLLSITTVGVAAGRSALRKHTKAISGVVKMDCSEWLSDYISDHYGALKYNGVFSNHVVSWALSCGCRDDSLIVKTASPSCETYCQIGDYFHGKGAFSQAEAYYKTASHMVPTRLTPKYKLWKLYVENGREASAIAIADRILTDPLKVETVFTARVKAEVENYLYNRTR